MTFTILIPTDKYVAKLEPIAGLDNYDATMKLTLLIDFTLVKACALLPPVSLRCHCRFVEVLRWSTDVNSFELPVVITLLFKVSLNERSFCTAFL